MGVRDGSALVSECPGQTQFVWVFNGGKLPSAVFSTRERAEAWIREHRLSGLLTKYPVDIPALEWMVEQGLFSAEKAAEMPPHKRSCFSSASQEHYHYEDGLNQEDSEV